MKEKNILLVSPLPPPTGGIASWTKEYLLYTTKNHINCYHINSAVTGDRANTWKISYMSELMRMFNLRKKIKNHIKYENISVIHYNASCFTGGLIRDYLVLRGIKKPIIYQCHCNLPTNLNNKIAKYMFGKISKIVNTICVLNSDSLNTAKKYHNNVKYVPNFINEEGSDIVEIKDELKEVCFVGRVENRKGINELLEASLSLPDINFNIIGPLEDEYEFDKFSNVRLLGKKDHDEVMDILKTMDAYILPSYSEGFSLGVLEAMSCGLPIIATNVGAARDMIGNKGGILIEVKSSCAIVDALNKIKDKQVRKKMSDYNIACVKKNYTIDVVMEMLDKIYDI